MHRWLLVVVVAVALLAAACGGDGEAASPIPTTESTRFLPTAPPTDATSTTVPTPTTVDAETEFRRAAVELFELRNEIHREFPVDPARVDEYVTANCECRASELERLTRFQAEGLHWDGDGVVPLGIRINPVAEGLPAAPTPLMTLILRQPPIRVVDAAGNVDEQFPDADLVAFDVAVERTDAGEWRLRLFEPNPFLLRDIASQIVQAGLP